MNVTKSSIDVLARGVTRIASAERGYGETDCKSAEEEAAMCQGRSARRVSLCALFLLSACVCPKVQLPASDSTPPKIAWRVRDKTTGDEKNFSGDGDLEVKWGHKLEIKATATDNEGVHQLDIGESAGWSCTNGSTNTSQPPDSATYSEHKDQWPNGEVCTEIEYFADEDLGWSCDSGYWFQGGVVTFNATAHNFYGGTTQSTLTIKVVP